MTRILYSLPYTLACTCRYYILTVYLVQLMAYPTFPAYMYAKRTLAGSMRTLHYLRHILKSEIIVGLDLRYKEYRDLDIWFSRRLAAPCYTNGIQSHPLAPSYPIFKQRALTIHSFSVYFPTLLQSDSFSLSHFPDNPGILLFLFWKRVR